MQVKVCRECLTSHPVAILQHIKYCSKWQNQQVRGLKRVATTILITRFK